MEGGLLRIDIVGVPGVRL